MTINFTFLQGFAFATALISWGILIALDAAWPGWGISAIISSAIFAVMTVMKALD